jgi:putative acetyltransferase
VFVSGRAPIARLADAGPRSGNAARGQLPGAGFRRNIAADRHRCRRRAHEAMTAGNPLKLAVEDPSQPEIMALLRAGDAFAAALYPAKSNHHMPLGALRAANVHFLVARNESGRAVGTGALVLHGAWAELKRMWVIPEARGLGVSKLLLSALEAHARREGVRALTLETGVQNHAAQGLYIGAGFARCAPFGNYRPDPLSVFMRKELSDLSE